MSTIRFTQDVLDRARGRVKPGAEELIEELEDVAPDCEVYVECCDLYEYLEALDWHLRRKALEEALREHVDVYLARLEDSLS